MNIFDIFKNKDPVNIWESDKTQFDFTSTFALTTRTPIKDDSDLFAVINKLSNDLASHQMISTNVMINALLQTPSQIVSPKAFYKAVYASLLLYGESFVYIYRDSKGRAISFEVLRNENVNYNQNNYSVNGLKYNVTFDDSRLGMVREVPQSNILHFKMLTLNGREVIRPLDALKADLELKQKLYTFASESLSHAIKLDGNLKILRDGLIPGTAKTARAKKIKNDTGANVLVTDSAEEFEAIKQTDEASQLISQLNWTTEQIAKVYDVPSDFVGGRGDQQSNAEQVQERYDKALKKYLDILADELSFKLKEVITY